MDLLIFLLQLFVATIVIILVYQTLKYMHTMWEFKNKKEHGDKGKKFKYFD